MELATHAVQELYGQSTVNTRGQLKVSMLNYTSQQGDKGGLQGPRLEGFTSNSLHTGSYCF